MERENKDFREFIKEFDDCPEKCLQLWFHQIYGDPGVPLSKEDILEKLWFSTKLDSVTVLFNDGTEIEIIIGTHLKFPRKIAQVLPLYFHVGTVIGFDGMDIFIVHWSGENPSLATLKIAPLKEVDNSFEILPIKGNDPIGRRMARAISSLGKGGYHVVTNNCEHFAHWVHTEERKSPQVKTFAIGVGVIIGALAAVLRIGSLIYAVGNKQQISRKQTRSVLMK